MPSSRPTQAKFRGRCWHLAKFSLLVGKKTKRGPLNMGLSVDVATGKLQDKDGRTYTEIYAIGPLRSGEAFESTAIPEIRKQASLIAENLADQLIYR